MISVPEAKKAIAENITPLDPLIQDLAGCINKISAANIYATVDIPFYPQSAMDGYAFAYKSVQPNTGLPITGVLSAGTQNVYTVKPGEAMRIFTGAAVPFGADTVLAQEKSVVKENRLYLADELLKQGANVRPRGSEIKAGELAFAEGDPLTAGAISFLAGIGVAKALVYPNPAVTIIVTGKELNPPGKILQYGQVYESNSFALQAALYTAQITNAAVVHAQDDLDIITTALRQALRNSHLVLITGGVSVGDYDFVVKAAANCGVQKIFHKVKQRPGKPLFFGMKDGRVPVLGLPGNPASVLTCFYEYVLPAIENLSKRRLALHPIQVPLQEAIVKKHSLVHFLKGHYNGNTVQSLEAQESYRMRSFAKANCLIQLYEEARVYAKGEQVEVHLLPV